MADFNQNNLSPNSVYDDLTSRYQRADVQDNSGAKKGRFWSSIADVIIFLIVIAIGYYVYAYQARAIMGFTNLVTNKPDPTWKEYSLGAFISYKIDSTYEIQTHSSEYNISKASFLKYGQSDNTGIDVMCSFYDPLSKGKDAFASKSSAAIAEVEKMKKNPKLRVSTVSIDGNDAYVVSPSGFGTKYPAYDVIQITDKFYCRYTLATKPSSSFGEDQVIFAKLAGSIKFKYK